MADNRYRDPGRGGWRDRDSSIFSDDDERWSGGRWSRAREDERGFLDRAGDEVRSWFGDEEADRRRELDMMRDDARSAFGGFERGEGRAGPAYQGDYGRGGFERGLYRWRQAGAESAARERPSAQRLGFGSEWDENYRRWRDRQIQQFDREYEEYRRERQQDFDQDFDQWRSSRLTRGGTIEGAHEAISGASATGAAARAMSPSQTSGPSGRGRGSRSRTE